MSWTGVRGRYKRSAVQQRFAYLDLDVDGTLFIIEFVIVVGVHLQVVEGKLFLDSLLECLTLFEGKGIGLGDDGDNIYNVRQLLQHNNINGLETIQKSRSASGRRLGDRRSMRLTHGQKAG